MQNFIEQFGNYAPIIFLLLASILPILLFPPGIFSVIGGLLFGFKLGAFLTIIAAIIYTNIMFLISRYFARNKIENFLEKRLTLKQFNRIFGLKDNKLATFLIICRLIPIKATIKTAAIKNSKLQILFNFEPKFSQINRPGIRPIRLAIK